MKQTILLLSIMLLFGCSNMMDSDRSQNYEWLDVENPTEKVMELSTSDYNRVLTAMERVEFAFDSRGAAILKTTSCKEINVSPNVYRYIMEIVSISNERFKNIPTRPRMLTRSESEEGNNNNSQSTPPQYFGKNCVAVSIAHATGIPQSIVERKLLDEYGPEGVPFVSFDEAMNLFGTWLVVQVSDHFDPRDIGNKGVVVYLGEDENHKKYLHAINISKIYSEGILGNDFQNSQNGTDFVPILLAPSQIKYIYIFQVAHNIY